jgi:hypothetical protein
MDLMGYTPDLLIMYLVKYFNEAYITEYIA